MKNYNIEKLEEAFKIIANNISTEGYETDLEKTFRKIDQKIEEDKKSFSIGYIMCGVGIIIILILLAIGRVKANSLPYATPYKTQVVDIVINNPQITIQKTVDKFDYVSNGNSFTASLWTINFVAPYTGWYEFKYWDMYLNKEGIPIGTLKSHTTFVRQGPQTLLNCLVFTYGYIKNGYYFNDTGYIKLDSVIFKTQ